MFRRQVGFSGKGDITFCPGRGNDLSRAAFLTMIIGYIRTCYEEVKEVIRFLGSGGVERRFLTELPTRLLVLFSNVLTKQRRSSKVQHW